MGKLISGIFGMDNGTQQAQAGIAAGREYAKDVTFKPVTIASTLAAMTGTPEGEYSGVMQPQLLGIGASSLTGAQQLLDTVAQFDPNSVTSQLFQQSLADLQPELRRQQIQLGQNVFKSGRGGLNVSGAAVGAPTGTGLVNPDAYGLMAAQTGVLGQLQTQAREQAFQEAMTTGQLGAGLMGTAMGIEEMAQKLIALGIDAQSARSAASAAAGQIGTGGYNMATQAAMNQDSAMGSFWGGLFGGAGAAYGAYKNPNSDIALKENIKLEGILPNGIKWYSWTWNNIAKKLGIDKQPTSGVLAQEVQKIIPEAVEVHPENGYLAVDYSKVLEA